jgi:hypothetical protein
LNSPLPIALKCAQLHLIALNPTKKMEKTRKSGFSELLRHGFVLITSARALSRIFHTCVKYPLGREAEPLFAAGFYEPRTQQLMNRLFDVQTTTKSGVSPAPSTEGAALRANISHGSVKYSG